DGSPIVFGSIVAVCWPFWQGDRFEATKGSRAEGGRGKPGATSCVRATERRHVRPQPVVLGPSPPRPTARTPSPRTPRARRRHGRAAAGVAGASPAASHGAHPKPPDAWRTGAARRLRPLGLVFLDGAKVLEVRQPLLHPGPAAEIEAEHLERPLRRLAAGPE